MTILWVYAYQMVPPQPSGRLGTIRALLDDGTAAAMGDGRRWSGRIVLERRATHILIVSDGPGRNDSINRQLEAELGRLDAPFTVTEPLAVVDHVVDQVGGIQAVATSNGNGHGAVTSNGNGH